MKAKRILAVVFTALLAISCLAKPAFADSSGSFTIDGQQMKNDCLSVSVSSNGTYTIGTTGGLPGLSTDDNKKLLYGWPSTGTTKTTMYVDDNYKQFIADSGTVKFDAAKGTVTCSTTYNGVQYTQKLTITFNSQTGNYDIVEIRYDIKNVSEATHKAGLRIMLDTMLGANDRAPFNVDGIGDVTTQKEFSGSAIPDSWRAFDSLINPTVIGYGYFKKNTGNLPDSVQFTSWQDVKDSSELWNAPVSDGRDNGDSAVTVKWLPRSLAPGKSMVCTTHYGLSKYTLEDIPFVASGDAVLSVVDNTYSPSKVKVTVMGENNGTVNYSNLKVVAYPQGDHLRIASGNSDTRSISTFSPGGKINQTFTFDVTPSSRSITEKIVFKLLDSSGNIIKLTSRDGTEKQVTTTFSVSIPALTLTTESLDLVFVIDTTGSMSNDIAQVRNNVKDYINALNSNGINYRIALVDYRDFSDRTGNSKDYAYSVQLNFTNNAESIQNALNNLTLGYGGDKPETVYSALVDGLRSLSWRGSNVLKAGIVLGDAPPLDPEPKTGYTLSTVVDAMNGTKAVGSSVSPILSGQSITLFTIFTGSSSSTDLFDKLAQGTSGKAYGGTNVDRAIEDFISWILFDIVINKQPVTNVVATGGRVNFTVEAKGYRLTYQWQVSNDGSSWSNISGATAASYSFTQADSNLNKKYRCVIKNASGKQAITRAVGYSIAPEIKITQQPADVTMKVGDTAQFTCKATGTGTLTYQWYYKKSGQTSWTLWSGHTTATTSGTVDNTWNGMQVCCKVKDAYTSVNSRSAKVTVAAITASVTVSPSTSVVEGTSTTFKCNATGTGLTYQWQYKKADQTAWNNWNGRTTASTTATANTTWNGMQVRCVVKNSSGNTVITSAVKLTTYPKAKITQQPANVSLKVGDTARFTVKATGTGTLTYQWYYKKSGQTAWSIWKGHTTAATTATVGDTWNGMQVYCKVKDAHSTVNSSAAKVTLVTSTTIAITSHPANVTVADGQTATFTVKATGTGTLKYQWYFKKVGGNWTKWNSHTTATTSATANSTWNGMKVYCVVSNESGATALSNPATITIKNAPIITQQPKNIALYSGKTGTFTVKATGTGPLKYQWYYKKSGQTAWTLWNGHTTASTSGVANDTWNKMQVYCKITDSNGSTSSSAATITIAAPLKITASPQNLVISEGGVAKFTVKATGTGLKYQWYIKKAGGTWKAWSGHTTASTSGTANSTWDEMQVRCLVTDVTGTSVYSGTATVFLM